MHSGIQDLHACSMWLFHMIYCGLIYCSTGGAIRTLTLFCFFFLLWHPLSDVSWLPTNRHWLPTNRHRLPTNRHRLPTNRHRLPTGHHRRACWTLRVFFFHYGTPAVVYPAAADYNVASSPMQKVILHSVPTDLLQKAPGAVLGS